jgi:selenide,water dikinase
LPPGDLDRALCGLAIPTNENVIVGLERADDAGVYKITDDLALIQTVDFFTPIVDDPYGFGQIAAANALSDIYAMGGVPKTAMNLVGFPLKEMDIGILRQIIQGGLDKMTEAGVVLVGGHSVEDDELKYGLAVTGTVHPQKVLTKSNLVAGDRLVLTKPIGTGVINTVIKGGMASAAMIENITRLMATLNRTAAEVMTGYRVHACTDITGFGFLGHLAEMLVGSGRSARLQAGRIPLVDQALEYAGMGLLPGGAFKNKEFRLAMVEFDTAVDPVLRDLLFDPQTSGGLLIGLPAAQAADLVADLVKNGVADAAVVGEVIDAPEERIIVGP